MNIRVREGGRFTPKEGKMKKQARISLKDFGLIIDKQPKDAATAKVLMTEEDGESEGGWENELERQWEDLLHNQSEKNDGEDRDKIKTPTVVIESEDESSAKENGGEETEKRGEETRINREGEENDEEKGAKEEVKESGKKKLKEQQENRAGHRRKLTVQREKSPRGTKDEGVIFQRKGN